MRDSLRNKVHPRWQLVKLGCARAGGVLRRHRRIGYIGGHEGHNLGDNAMFEIGRELLKPYELVTYERPFIEQRLGRVGLSAPTHLRPVVLGGGTLINPLWQSKVALALRQGAALWSLGTGVGCCGFGQAERIELSTWPPLLRDFAGLGVRGPRSVAVLADLGVKAELLGDLALAGTVERVTPPSNLPRLAVNIALPKRMAVRDVQTLVELRTSLASLLARGWRCRPIAMNPADVRPIRELLADLDGVDELVTPTSLAEFVRHVRDCRFTVAVRLHAAVFSCCAGVPVCAIGYRSKCLDFMESMNLAAWHVALDDTGAGSVTEKIEMLSGIEDDMRVAVLARAQAYRDKIRVYVGRIVLSSDEDVEAGVASSERRDERLAHGMSEQASC
jgi:hypothetical protein